MKDNEIRILHDNLAACARRFASTQQLRSRLVAVIAPLVKALKRKKTWMIRPIKNLGGSICGYELDIPDLPGVLHIESYKVEGNEIEMADQQVSLGQKRIFVIDGEIKVPDDVGLVLVE